MRTLGVRCTCSLVCAGAAFGAAFWPSFGGGDLAGWDMATVLQYVRRGQRWAKLKWNVGNSRGYTSVLDEQRGRGRRTNPESSGEKSSFRSYFPQPPHHDSFDSALQEI